MTTTTPIAGNYTDNAAVAQRLKTPQSMPFTRSAPARDR